MTFDENTTYKVLKNGRSCYGGRGSWTPMRWRSIKGKPVACERGIHYCRGAQVVEWLGPDLWLFEDGGDEHDDRDDKCVTNRGRITERIEAWNEETARLFAVDCARAVIRYARDDQRELLHACLDVAAGVALGYTDDAARAAAWDAARAAARDAARTDQYALLCRYLSGEQGPFVEADDD